jgi:hypothetical protein
MLCSHLTLRAHHGSHARAQQRLRRWQQVHSTDKQPQSVPQCPAKGSHVAPC